MGQRTIQPTEQAKTAGEGEINRQQEFFDPTRKVERTESAYQFSYDLRLEVGYVQNQQRSATNSWSNPFLHGAKLGATIDFNLPYSLSLQTGLAFCGTYGIIDQHWRSMSAETVQTEYIRHGINQYYLEVPVRAFYTLQLWRELNLFFYGGPKMQIGLAEIDFETLHLSDNALEWLSERGVAVTTHDRYSGFSYADENGVEKWQDRELRRFNIQLGVGGGLEWAQYRLIAGYDFGLNNLLYQMPTSNSRLWQWGWYVSFCYKL